MTEGRPPKPAAVAVAVTLGSALGGHAEPAAAAYASADAAREAAVGLAGRAAAAAAERYAGSVRLQALAGQVRGPCAPAAPAPACAALRLRAGRRRTVGAARLLPAPAWAEGRAVPHARAARAQGALTAMEDVELQHWMRVAAARTAAAGARAVCGALAAHARGGGAHHEALEVGGPPEPSPHRL